MKQQLLRKMAVSATLVLAAGAFGSQAMAQATAPVVVTPASAEPGAKGPGHERPGHGKPGHGPRGKHAAPGLMVPGLGPLPQAQVDALGLNAEQTALLQGARTAQKAAFDAGREAFKAGRGDRSKPLDAATFDPRAALAAHDAARTKVKAQADAARTEWLKVWDALTPAQRTQVVNDVNTHRAKMAEAHKARGEGRGDESRPARSRG